MKTLPKEIIKHIDNHNTFMVILCLLLLNINTANAQNNKAISDIDDSHIVSDTIKAPLHGLLSFHTNIIDWALTTPNVSVELDLDRRKRNCISLLLNAKYNPQTHHSFNPRWVYNISSVRGEIRKYWRTGNFENAKYPEIVEQDTTTWFLPRTTGYYYRKYMSGRYVKRPRTWRAYYLGLYATYGNYSICLGNEGAQGKYGSVGLSFGWDIPLYTHYDGSGWDLEYGVSAGPTLYNKTTYDYYDESGCYLYGKHQPKKWMPLMVQDIHVSLVYRFRTIAKKVRFGADRFARHEEKRLERIEARIQRAKDEKERMDSIAWEQDVDKALADAKLQLSQYTDTTSASYVLLKTELKRVEKDIRETKTEVKAQGDMMREVLAMELSYYQQKARELDPNYSTGTEEETATSKDGKKGKKKKVKSKRNKKNQKDETETSEGNGENTSEISVDHGVERKNDINADEKKENEE